VLTISRLSLWSIAYYEKTANEAKQATMDRKSAGGGLGEYYSEGDTRVPTWMVAGDAVKVGELTGLTCAALASGFVDGERPRGSTRESPPTGPGGAASVRDPCTVLI
jgi:hypothetical protein